jgi:type VI secretion system protein ImpK
MDQEKSSARVQSLPDLAASLFSLILSLRSSAAYGRLEELRSRIGEYLDRIDKEGRDAGIAREDIEAAKYPLVAFIDEIILNSQWDGRERWREHPLQLDLYGDTVAGERFFERMDKVRAKGEAKAELLQIYWLCMALGFEGKYKIAGRQKLTQLVDEIRRELGFSVSALAKAPISPHGRRRDAKRTTREAGLPALRIVAGCVGGLALLFLVLWLLIGHSESSALQKLNLLPG